MSRESGSNLSRFSVGMAFQNLCGDPICHALRFHHGVEPVEADGKLTDESFQSIQTNGSGRIRAGGAVHRLMDRRPGQIRKTACSFALAGAAELFKLIL